MRRTPLLKIAPVHLACILIVASPAVAQQNSGLPTFDRGPPQQREDMEDKGGFERQQFREEMEQIRKEHEELQSERDKLRDEFNEREKILDTRQQQLHERTHALHEKMEAMRHNRDQHPDDVPNDHHNVAPSAMNAPPTQNISPTPAVK